MAKKPTYEELEQKIKKLKKGAVDRKLTEDLIRTQLDLGIALSSTSGLDEGLRLCLEAALDLSGMDCGGVYLVDETSKGLDLIFHKGLSTDFVKNASHFDTDSDTMRLVMEAKPVYSQHQVLDIKLSPARQHEKLKAIAVLPLSQEGRVIGCLNVASHDLEEVPVFARVTLEAIATQIVNAIIRLSAQEKARESEKKYRDLVHLCPDAVVILQDEHYQLINPVFTRLFGYTQQDIDKGLSFFQLVQKHDRKAVRNRYKDRLAGKYLPTTYRIDLIAKNGKIIPCETSAAKVLYQDRPADLTIIRNITERKQAQDTLKKYESIVSSAQEHMSFVDKNYVYKAVNNSYLKAHNKKREEILGFSVPELLGTRVFKEIVKGSLDRCLAGEEIHYESWFDFPGLGKRYMDVAYYPFFEADRSISGIVVSSRDITDRKQAEKTLIESEKRYRSLVENIALGIARIDSDYNIVMMNAFHGKLFRKHPNEFIGKKCFQEFEKREKVCPHCPGFQAIKTGQAAEVETVGVRDDGTKFDVRICAFPISGSDGTVTEFIEIVEDITEKKTIEAQFQKAQKMEAIGTLAGGIAHDFNNLLMTIQGNTSLMFHGIDSSHPHYKRLKSIEKQIQSGVKLTGQLLGYACKGKYEVKPVSLNRIINETSDAFRHTKKEISVHKKLAEDLFAIEADQGQIEQVLLNLFVNAANAMPSGGHLILETMNVTQKDLKNKLYRPRADKYVMLTVKDTGIGMDKRTMEHIFEPFFTTKEMGRGTGLGLASVYGIIKTHGGYIDVESNKKHGTTFMIYLPASKNKVREVTKTSDKLIKGIGTVLLVDDEKVIQEVCKELLENIGYKVFSAIDGKEALKLYRKNQNKIDLVLLDMIMPNMSGGEVYDRIKEINPCVKVLLSSGYSINGEATEILKRGCDSFIQKPFDMKKLSAKIRKILNNK